ncbi:MAG: chorismate synthase [Oscillospiraceae bacterium]|nr:chorismate synthase [Oscillospiraceae bacterium]
MSSTYGENLKLSIFGQSHGAGIGMTLDGIPAGLPVDLDKLQQFLNRRAPGQNDWSTPRREEDRPEFLAGLLDGYTCGAPIAAVIYNKNTRSKDYSNLHDVPRPGHADYTAQVKYGGFQDVAGGGHFSGRLTAPLCIAGGLCKQWLEQEGIRIGAHILGIAGVPKYDDDRDEPAFDTLNPELDQISFDFPVLSTKAGEKMREHIAAVRAEGDSVGGMIECAVTGLPAGLGDPMFGGMESRIASIVYGVPAVKYVDFGAGVAAAYRQGSENNDSYYVEDGIVKTMTNHCGGILGGITNGMPLIFRAAIKPTPSISQPQQSVSLSRMENTTLEIKGRHDPCIVPRAVPVIEAAAAIAIYDAVLARRREIGGI